MPFARTLRTASRRQFLLIRLTLLMAPWLLLAGGLHAQQVSQPLVHAPVTPLSSDGLSARSLAPIQFQLPTADVPVRQRGDLEVTSPLAPVTGPAAADPLVQLQLAGPASAPPTIVRTIEIIPQQPSGLVPPDVTIAVGPNHIIEMVNNALAIYSKTGATLLGPIAIHTLWSGIGPPCGTQDAGDPIVRYDRAADRWLISQFELNERFQCIGVSKGPDPVTDGWHLYAFPTQTATGVQISADYPKIGVWQDGYYMGTQRGFPNSGLDVWVFERDKMLTGAPARQIQFNVAAPSLFLLPGDFDGQAPPAGTPNVFARHVDGDLWGGQDRLELFEFKTDWANPSASTFQLKASLPTAPFSAVLCNNQFMGACADQPGTPQKLETLPAWMMWRLQYRNFGTHETLVTNHTVNAGGNHAAIRWYELRKPPGGAWSIFQQGTHAPDAAHRFMGSIAMDEAGNMALGFTASSTSIFPSLRVATRSASDPAGVLPSEITLKPGTGSQTTSFLRWGDYSSMEVDPDAPCRFWYAGEYYPTTSPANWHTAAVAVQMPSCGSALIARADYCRFVGNAPNIFFSCGTASGNTFGNYDVSAKPWSQGGLDPGYSNMPQLMADVNADGKPDYCRFVGNAPNIFLSCALQTSNGFGQYDVNGQQGYDPGYSNMPRFMADVNGDGRADYCRFVGNAPNIFLSCGLASGNSFGNYDVNGKPWSQGGLDPGYDNMPRFMVDVNGDGKADYCRFVGNAPNIFLSCALSTGTGFGQYDVSSQPGYDAGYANMSRFMADVNGDGRADYCRYVGNAPNIFLSCGLASGNKFGNYDVNGKPWSQGGLDPGYDNMPRFLVDVNGDKKADYCRFVGNAPNIFLSCALSSGTGFGQYEVNGQQGYDAGYGNMPRFLLSVTK
jgi:hypothetical protein